MSILVDKDLVLLEQQSISEYDVLDTGREEV